MKTASIVSIGNELLTGRIVDTNAQYLAAEFLSIGIPVVSFHTVGDDIDPIVRALQLAGADADVVLATGGLGPTDDDLTRQALSKFLHTELQLEKKLLQNIEAFFTRRNLHVPPQCKAQAYIPAGVKILPNNLGTAAGLMAKVKNKLFFSMPGVPDEMKQMFEQSVSPRLKRLAHRQAIVVKRLNCFGATESQIAHLLGTLCQRTRNPQINCTVKHGVIALHIIATATDKNIANRMVRKDEKLLRSILGDLVYGTQDQTLAEVVGKKLAQQKKTIAVAESCTGGCLARLLTDVPGASRYFTHGWVTYSNAAKTSQLSVRPALIKKYGAVSKQVAQAMAQAAGKKAAADFAIAITGIAGPTGASKQKPVGLVYISLWSSKVRHTRRFIFSHDRLSIRQRAAQTALNMLRLALNV